MKKYLSIIGVLVTTIVCYSQPQTLQTRSAGGTIAILHPEDTGYTGEEIEGTPYIIEAFVSAKVDKGDQLFKIRYNGFTDQMEFEKDGELYDIDTNLHTEVSFEGMNKKYIHSQYGYLLELFKGNNFIFYKKEKIELKERKKATTSFQQDIPAKYIRKKDVYYVQLSDKSIVELPKSKNKIIEFVNDKKSVNEYIKKNNLNISEENDLVILFKYMDKLN